ncbi:CK1 family protein kinase [Tritrichomonas foetus]|uniref:non-specific serine/threonine protein kinase n=1 Tax=Tritrichomonas foetus TaxID=1144522 RepID=A0A1J4JQ60_9EUKA|nr:CK1 family protein kinase [Tritrichomonas foetus]|eukprot:OHT01187.1 CK1 family protein kinase [Tritrichomonas foetus]
MKLNVGDEVSFYTLVHKIGGGGFGEIWKVKSSEDDRHYAMKLESSQASRHTLNFETSVLKKLQFCDKFPIFKMDGNDSGYYFLVMELCGPNLSTIAQRLPNGHFTRENMHLLFYEMLTILEQFHRTGYVHRDIKPQNFVTRFNGNSPIVLIDYGISKLYVNSQNQHIEARGHAAAIGSLLYSSPNTADHMELSRRDDLYSLVYSVLDIGGVPLPWRGAMDPSEAGELKKANPISKLMEPFGPGFVEVAKHIESLNYADAPNYPRMKEWAIHGANKSAVFQWMTTPSNDPQFLHLATSNHLNFDPTGILLELSPYMVSGKKTQQKGKKPANTHPARKRLTVNQNSTSEPVQPGMDGDEPEGKKCVIC